MKPGCPHTTSPSTCLGHPSPLRPAPLPWPPAACRARGWRSRARRSRCAGSRWHWPGPQWLAGACRGSARFQGTRAARNWDVSPRGVATQVAAAGPGSTRTVGELATRTRTARRDASTLLSRAQVDFAAISSLACTIWSCSCSASACSDDSPMRASAAASVSALICALRPRTCGTGCWERCLGPRQYATCTLAATCVHVLAWTTPVRTRSSPNQRARNGKMRTHAGPGARLRDWLLSPRGLPRCAVPPGLC
jgi:hypothetical protein